MDANETRHSILKAMQQELIDQSDHWGMRDAEMEGVLLRQAIAIGSALELARSAGAVIAAFERLGSTNDVVSQLETHRQCERAMLDMESAYSHISGGWGGR